MSKFKITLIILLLILFATFWVSGCIQKAADKPAKQPTGKPTGGAGKMFQLKSSAFEGGQRMPTKYANTGVGGQNISIPLSWGNPPEGTQSFAIAMVDRHPVANNWVHWLVINIPNSTTSLPEGASGTNSIPAGSKELNNTFRFQGYGGPQPPPGTGDHDYETTIYALNVESLTLEPNVSLGNFMSAIEGKVIGSAKLTGRFSR